MRILKNLFYLFLMIGITFLACQAKGKKLSPDDEIRLLKNLVKEKTEAAQAEMEYWEKMGLVGGLIDAQVSEVNEKQISLEAFNGLKNLKDPLFDLLASSERIGVKKLRERYEAAKKALNTYAEDYIEDYVKEPEAVSTEAAVSIESETIPINNGKEVGITMGLPPTPELPPLAPLEEREDIFAVKEESMQVKPEISEEIPPTPPSPGAMGIPVAPGMAPSTGMAPTSEVQMGMEVPEPMPEAQEQEMGMMPSSEPSGMVMEAPTPEMGGMEMEVEEVEEVEEMQQVPGMGMAPASEAQMGMEVTEPMPEIQEQEMGMMPAEPMEMEAPTPEMGGMEMEVEEVEEVEETQQVPDMGMEPAPEAQMGMEVPETVPEIPEEEMGMMPSAEPSGMGMEMPIPEMGGMEMEVEEEVEEPVGMTFGMEDSTLTGLESFEKYKNLNLAMNSSEDSPDIENDEEDAEDDM